MEVRDMQFVEVELEIALIGDDVRVFDCFRDACKQAAHFLFALQIELVVGKAHPVCIADRFARLNAQKDVVRMRILALHIVHVVGRDERDSGFL